MLSKEIRQSQGHRLLQAKFIRDRHGANDEELAAGRGRGCEECEEGVKEAVRDLDVLPYLHTLHQAMEVIQNNDGCLRPVEVQYIERLYMTAKASTLYPAVLLVVFTS